MIKIQGTIKNIVNKIDNIPKGSSTEKVTQNISTELPNSSAINSSHIKPYALISSHKETSDTIAFGLYPQEYVQLASREWVEEQKIIAKFGKYKGTERTIPAHWNETYTLKPHYHIDKLWSRGKGSGTNSVKAVVQKSLEDIETQGRVTLDADCIDGKTSPAGFYYKLGFRFTNPALNETCEKWLLEGGLRENAPFCQGIMFLPKENISKCLNY